VSRRRTAVRRGDPQRRLVRLSGNHRHARHYEGPRRRGGLVSGSRLSPRAVKYRWAFPTAVFTLDQRESSTLWSALTPFFDFRSKCTILESRL
jgi:hypothetical protein